MPDHPHRIRLHGGRHIHAARTVHGDEGDYQETACGNRLYPDEAHHWQPAARAVTCPPCIRKATR